MRIYTKSGDKGETGLIGGARVAKSSLRIAAIGAVDELNAHIGVLLVESEEHTEHAEPMLTTVQAMLFGIGAILADPKDTVQKMAAESDVELLERAIDGMEDHVPPLKNFILPGGTPFAAHSHLARAVCRRAERLVVKLFTKGKVARRTRKGIVARTNSLSEKEAVVIKYLNRLSDFLFMLGRADNHTHGMGETKWMA